jgi:hypothetical protein
LEACESTTIGGRLHVTNVPRLEGVIMDLFFLGEEGLDMDDIQDCEQDGFWNNSEDDTSEESEGDVETCVKECHDIHDEQDG